jgi:hypothetical protein
MRITKARRKKLAEAGRRGGPSKSAAKVAAVKQNGRRHTARLKLLEEIFAEEADKFKVAHPDLFPA